MDLSAVRFLVVDDNRQSRELVTSVLGSVGAHGIRHAATAADAFERLRQEPVDVVILDHNLGAGGAGIELARRLRQDPASPSPFLAILMLTSHADERLVRSARDAGVTEFLLKPFNVAGLLRRIEALLMQPRPFVRSAEYAGPDRRRRSARGYGGAERRRRD